MFWLTTYLYQTGVINDPLGQPDSLAHSYEQNNLLFPLEICLCYMIFDSVMIDGCTDLWTEIMISTGPAKWIN